MHSSTLQHFSKLHGSYVRILHPSNAQPQFPAGTLHLSFTDLGPLLADGCHRHQRQRNHGHTRFPSPSPDTCGGLGRPHLAGINSDGDDSYRLVVLASGLLGHGTFPCAS